MKKLLILIVFIFPVSLTMAQSTCDAEMEDTLTNINYPNLLTRSIELNNENADENTKSMSMVLRKDIKYILRVGNSLNSKSAISVELSAKKIEDDSYVKIPAKIEKTGSNSYTISWAKGEKTEEQKHQVQINPGVVSSIEVDIHKTDAYDLHFKAVENKKACSVMGIFVAK